MLERPFQWIGHSVYKMAGAAGALRLAERGSGEKGDFQRLSESLHNDGSLTLSIGWTLFTDRLTYHETTKAGGLDTQGSMNG